MGVDVIIAQNSPAVRAIAAALDGVAKVIPFLMFSVSVIVEHGSAPSYPAALPKQVSSSKNSLHLRSEQNFSGRIVADRHA